MAFSVRSSRSIRRRNSRARRRDGGFSLVEILIVVGIIGLLVALVGPNVMRQFQGSQSKTAKIQIEALRSSLDLFMIDVGRYPDDREGLAALVDRNLDIPGWKGPYLRDGRVPQDPWGRPYIYATGEGGVAIRSLGADGQPGGEGVNADIAS